MTREEASLSGGLGLWSAFFAGALGAVYAGLALGGPGEPTVLVVTVVVGVLLIGIERLRPRRPEWRKPDGQWWTDIGHFVVGFGLGSFGGAATAQWLFSAPLWAAWPTRWPLVLQVALGLVVAELFGYWQHRALHAIPFLWPLHALHHSTGRMTFFKTTRIHALDIGTFTLLSVASLLAFGAPTQVVLWVTAFGNFAAQTQHANVRFATPPWLDALVGTPAVHWLHHSIDKREGNSNFGMNVMVFDHLFGTYLSPDPARVLTLGIEEDVVPRSFLAQVGIPWQMVRRLARRS